MEYTKEQLKAAYALNLCTVSISQIIDYDDINVMEQEYEAILNNINLEQMPKDEALLHILKQILDVITYFRIQEGDKKFLDMEYQQKMRNAIWSAVPNIGLLVAGGSPLTMAVSLASQVGIGYMNYRRQKASIQFEAEKERWQLERAAVDQFNGLRRELFDTAWRLSKEYKFPDELRLTERQIKQYDNILMDGDILRRYERLDSIKEEFLAYPPFWYQLGSTANEIANSSLSLDKKSKNHYRSLAKDAFLQYRQSNDQGLLREDQVGASCALELADLLDINKDKKMISTLMSESVKYSGKKNDVMQMAAITYLRLREKETAKNILRILVNEQYNTILNAQLLSSLYVGEYIEKKSEAAYAGYQILQTRIGDRYLYPMPAVLPADRAELDNTFLEAQASILKRKYDLVLAEIHKKYEEEFNAIIPLPQRKGVCETDNWGTYTKGKRKYLIKDALSGYGSESYKVELQLIGIPYRIIDVMNDMYAAADQLPLMNENIKAYLTTSIENEIEVRRDYLNRIQSHLTDGIFDDDDIDELSSLDFKLFTDDFFDILDKKAENYVKSRKSLEDFSIADQSLSEFCGKEGLPSPEELFEKDNEETVIETYRNTWTFDYDLLGNSAIKMSEEMSNINTMANILDESIPKIVKRGAETEFYSRNDARTDRYFSKSERLRKDIQLRAETLAILDDPERKDFDLIFTSYGIIPIKGGHIRKTVAYSNIKWIEKPYEGIMIDGIFMNDDIDLYAMFELIKELDKYAKPITKTDEGFVLKFPGRRK